MVERLTCLRGDAMIPHKTGEYVYYKDYEKLKLKLADRVDAHDDDGRALIKARVEDDTINEMLTVANIDAAVEAGGDTMCVLTTKERVGRLQAERDFFEDAVQWMSGSADFGVDGKAHKGWLKHQRELKALRTDKEEKYTKFSGKAFKDGCFWLAEIPAIDTMTQGHTREEVCEMVEDLIENFVNEEDFKATVHIESDNTFEVTGSDPQKMKELYEKRSGGIQ